jgi:predicted nucleic acid-binding protein
MTVVDTSVWIDYFNGAITPETDRLDNLLGVKPIGLGDLILTEILQGFRKDKDFNVALQFLEKFTVFHLLGPKSAIVSARNYRFLRTKGITVRKTTDTIIATYCIENNHSLLYSDRDFDPFVRFLGLHSEK